MRREWVAGRMSGAHARSAGAARAGDVSAATPPRRAGSPASSSARAHVVAGRRRRRRLGGGWRPPRSPGCDDRVGKTRGARERHAILEDSNERRTDAAHPLERGQRPERAEAVAVGDDARGERRPDPRQGLQLAGRGDVHVHRLCGEWEWGSDDPPPPGARVGGDRPSARRAVDAAARLPTLRPRSTSPSLRTGRRVRRRLYRSARRVHGVELPRERDALLGPRRLAPHRPGGADDEAEAGDAGEEEERPTLRGGRVDGHLRSHPSGRTSEGRETWGEPSSFAAPRPRSPRIILRSPNRDGTDRSPVRSKARRIRVGGSRTRASGFDRMSRMDRMSPGRAPVQKTSCPSCSSCQYKRAASAARRRVASAAAGWRRPPRSAATSRSPCPAGRPGCGGS